MCLSKIAGKAAAYPAVDTMAFQRFHSALLPGLKAKKLGDYCQELRAVAKCPARELVSFPRTNEVEARIAAIVNVVSQRAELTEDTFRDLLTAVLSWSSKDQGLILGVLTDIIHGKSRS
jgi:hypothetical protein